MFFSLAFSVFIYFTVKKGSKCLFFLNWLWPLVVIFVSNACVSKPTNSLKNHVQTHSFSSLANSKRESAKRCEREKQM